MRGPCFCASVRMARWMLGLVTRWWRLPITGRVHGPGGRLCLGFAASSRDLSFERTTTSTDTDKTRSTLPSIEASYLLWLLDLPACVSVFRHDASQPYI